MIKNILVHDSAQGDAKHEVTIDTWLRYADAEIIDEIVNTLDNVTDQELVDIHEHCFKDKYGVQFFIA